MALELVKLLYFWIFHKTNRSFSRSDTDECRENNGGCSELCINTLGGNECGCHKDGYAVGEDGVTCEDVDECVNDNGGCSDLCENLDGGFQCACAPGRMMTEDGANCM